MKNTKKLKSKFGFTLAEVLITLVIIGVIAAATIPTLLQKHFEQEMVSKLKKNFSVLNNAYLQAIRENGTVDEWELGTQYSFDGAQAFYEILKPYLKVQKDCASANGCFGSSYKSLYANTTAYAQPNTSRTIYKFILEDGTSVSINSSGKGGTAAPNNKPYKRTYGTISIDLNNTKGPNRMGRDYFILIATENNIIPFGVGYAGLDKNNEERCKYNSQSDVNGSFCGTHVIYKGNMDYLRHEINTEW